MPEHTHQQHQGDPRDREKLDALRAAPAGEQQSTTPRANPDRDDYDVERGEAKLERVVGN